MGSEEVEPYLFWASCTSGFEHICDAELQLKVPGYSRVRRVETVGKVVFEVDPSSVSPARLVAALRGLHSVEYLFAAVCVVNELPTDNSVLAMLRQPSSVGGTCASFQSALAMWGAWRVGGDASSRWSSVDAGPPKPTFRVSPKRGGSHPFSGTDLAQALACGVVEENGWKPELVEYDVDVFAHLRFDTLFCGLRLNTEPLSMMGDLVRHGRDKSKTTLKQSIAYCLCASGNLPRDRPATLVVDAMAGCGTIGECAVGEWRGVFCISGDSSAVAVEKAGVNAAALPASCGGGRLDVVRWDASNLPLRDGCVDDFVIDMPFGKRMGCHANNARMYPRAMGELVRCMALDGKAVLLTSAKALVTRELMRDRMWKKHVLHSINQGGMMVSVFVLGKRYAERTIGADPDRWQRRRGPRGGGARGGDELAYAQGLYALGVDLSVLRM